MISRRFTAKATLLLVGLMLLIGCTQKAPTKIRLLDNNWVEQNQLIDLSTGKSITPEQLIQQLAQASYVIVGEKHDNRYHHQIEQWLVQEMQQVRPQGAVLLEMLTPSQQKDINRVKVELQGNTYIRDERLQKAIKWNTGWPWDQYGELIKFLLEQPYPVLAANLDKDDITKAYANPQKLTGVYSTQAVVQEIISKTIETSHGGELTTEQIAKMTVIQQMRDRAMANALIKAPKPALLFAGGYHATRAIGVPLHLQDISPETELKVLIISEKGSEIDNLHADFVWYTPTSD